MRNLVRKFVAIVQLYGAAGLVYLIAEALWRHPLNVGIAVSVGACPAFAVAAAFGGIRLWQNKDRGILLSLITQLMQLLTVTSPLVSYSAVLGAAVWIGISISERGPNLLFDAAFGYSAFLYNVNIPSMEFSARVNLVAGFFALFLHNEYLKRFHPL